MWEGVRHSACPGTERGPSDVTASPETLQIALTATPSCPVAEKRGTPSCSSLPQGQAASQSQNPVSRGAWRACGSALSLSQREQWRKEMPSQNKTRWPICIYYSNQCFSSARNHHSQRNWFSQNVSRRVDLQPPCPIKAPWPNITSYPLA